MKSMLPRMACFITLLYLSACVKDTDTNPNIDRTLSKMDLEFMNKASSFNNSELAGVRLAEHRTYNGYVGYYTARLFQDEYNRQADLQVLADIWGITIPNTPDSAHTLLFQQLQSYPPRSYTFDTAYMKSQLIDQAYAVALYQHEADAGTNKNLRDYANKYLPQVKQHKYWADSILLRLQ
jgi:putative membrane protein